MKEIVIISGLFIVGSLFSKGKVDVKSAKIYYTPYLAKELKRKSDYVKRKS